jgi:hypothetical protein
MREFFSYFWVVLRWTGGAWWSLVRDIVVWEILFWGLAVAVGYCLQPRIVSYWPSLQPYLEDRMSSVAYYVVFGLAAVGAIVLVIGIGCLIVAPSQIHKEQQEALAQSKKEVAEAALTIKAKDDLLATRQPDLRGEVRTRAVFALFNEQIKRSMTMIALYIVVRNTGEPSIAENWLLTLTVPGHDPIALKPVTFDEEAAKHFAAMSPQKQLRMFERDRQLNRVTREPIQKGAASSGWFVAWADVAIGNIDADKIGCTVEFTDINGKRHECTNTEGEMVPEDMQIQMQGDL